MNQTKPSRDFGFIAVLAMMVAVTVWLLLTPWVGPIAASTMQRFHLRSESFITFAAQFPIPAMYNFANTSQVTEIPPGMTDPLFAELDDESDARYVNHFPARRITFSDARFTNLLTGQDRWFTLRSIYRGQTFVSKWHLEPREQGGFTMRRQADP